LAIRRNELSGHKKDMNLECMLLSERSQSEEATHSMIPTLTFWKRHNYRDSQKMSGCHEFGEWWRR